MSMHHCFDRGTVIPDLRSTDKFDALRELIQNTPVFNEITDKGVFENAVIARERLCTTGFGHGVAVAHGRAPGVKRVLIALGVSRQGLAFDAPDGEPVRLLFVIASPVHVSLEYLQVLSTLVRCLRHQTVRDALLVAEDAAGLEATIRKAFSAGLEPVATPSVGRQPCGAAS
jgi:mannitol/fructose-specific phosphotransferase system IIA component (Ntr-type)